MKKKPMDPMYQTVLAAFAKLNMLQSIPIESEVLDQKARIFAEELEGWSLETVKRAFQQHGRESRYVPALSEILDHCREAQRAITREKAETQARLAAPDVSTEERARNIERLQAIKDRLNRRMKERTL